MAKRVREGTSGVQVPQQGKLESSAPPPSAKRCRAAPEASGEWAVGQCPAGLPRWRQLWEGRGGGMAVDYEELLWGWFPFVDEDFSCEGEEGWLCIWGYDEQRHALCE
ncbi:unnamed protein product [Spirodela intermedia]|uniref:Uncharacterized protein n=1 Tax=Spirodela intermedia TaxID=51605 RepID=A0A7I8LF89_SPIIN|nr:unnamed protein product [Spirodela intermedia]